ncbi:MAG: right-handed parallel beta-helix repeat-containing protein [Pseudomonadota bacterium]|nr:right-handed parallel beta-helix repeat-containing protein [Pseudomonadota bacterium]
MRSPLMFLVLLTGCTGPSDKADTGTNPDDTGDTDTVEYDQGCITVDGGGGYANINDAITVAPEGAVIALCDGTYEEAVIVDKAVTLRGASVDGTFLTGPGADIPLTITATGVTVENLVVTSARTGIDLKRDSEATLSMITIAAAGSWGVSATNATAVITGLTVVEPAAGGVQVSGGTVSLTDSSFEYPGAYGIDITDDAVVSVTNTTITGTVMLSDDISDGYAVQIDGASLTMTGSTIAGADGMGISANEADIVLVDTTIQDAEFLALFAFDSTFDLSGVTVTGSLLQGIYAQGPSFTMVDSTITGDSALSCSYLYAEWGQSGNPWCGGLLVAADTIDLSGVSVSGYNNYGMLLQPSVADVATVSVTGGTVNDAGRWGAYFYATEGTISGLTVSNSREPEILDPCAGYINQSAGLLADSSDLTLDNVTVTGNAGWGMSQVLSTAVVSNSLFDGNGCYTFVNYQSVATLTGNTFSHGAANGGIYDSAGVLVVDSNTFSDNSSGDYSEYDYGHYIYTYEASGGQGQDLFAYETGSLTVTNNTFVGGDSSVTAYLGAAVEITGNTWTDYEGTIFAASDLSAPAIFADNIVDDVAGSVVQSSYSEVEVENVQVGTTRASEVISVTYSYDYPDDASDFSGSYTTQTASTVFYASGYYYDDGTTITEESAALTLRDVSVTSAYSSVIYASDASIDVSGLEVGSTGGAILNGYWSGIAPDVEIDGLTAGAVASSAVTLSNAPVTDFGSVSLSDFHVESTGGSGVTASSIGALTLTDVTFGDVSGTGVSTVARSNDYYYDYDDDGTYLGIVYVDFDAATEVTIDGLSIGSASGNGLSFQGGSAAISGFTASGVSGNGIDAKGLTALVVSDSTLTAPGGTGFFSTDSYSYYAYEAGATLMDDGNTAASLTNTTVTDAGGNAFVFDGGSVTMSGVSGSSSTSSGLSLANVTADVQGNTFSGSPEYGMTCAETVTLAECATNDLSGNTLGTQLGCSESCAE